MPRDKKPNFLQGIGIVDINIAVSPWNFSVTMREDSSLLSNGGESRY